MTHRPSLALYRPPMLRSEAPQLAQRVDAGRPASPPRVVPVRTLTRATWPFDPPSPTTPEPSPPLSVDDPLRVRIEAWRTSVAMATRDAPHGDP